MGGQSREGRRRRLGRGERAMTEAEEQNRTIRNYICTVHRLSIDLTPLILKMTAVDIVLCLQMEENCCRETDLGSQYLRFSPALPSAFLSEFPSGRDKICWTTRPCSSGPKIPTGTLQLGVSPSSSSLCI